MLELVFMFNSPRFDGNLFGKESIVNESIEKNFRFKLNEGPPIFKENI